MNQKQQAALMARVQSQTPGGGGSPFLHFVSDVVRAGAPNDRACEKPSHCANMLERTATLLQEAAKLLRDPDFIAKNADVFFTESETP